MNLSMETLGNVAQHIASSNGAAAILWYHKGGIKWIMCPIDCDVNIPL